MQNILNYPKRKYVGHCMIQIKLVLHLLGPALQENIEQVQRTENRTLWETLRDISKERLRRTLTDEQ